MANAARSSAPAAGAPGKSINLSTSRRSLLGFAAAAPIAALPLPALAADTTAWDRAWRAYVDARDASERFQAERLAPLSDRHPKAPDMVERVGTHRKTGEPVTHLYEPIDFIEASAWSSHPAAARAKQRWDAYQREVDAFEAETGFSELEDRADDLIALEADACQAMLCTPAAHLPALYAKLRAIYREGEEWRIYDEDVHAAMRADLERLAPDGQLH